MASPKPQVSDSAVGEVQVIDSSDPLATTSAVPSCSVGEVQVIDSSDPLATTSAVPSCSVGEVQVIDSSDPLATTSAVPSCSVGEVRVLDSSEPLGTLPAMLLSGSDAGWPTNISEFAIPTSGSSGARVNSYSEELRSMWNWRRIFSRLGTHEQCVQFAEERGLVLSEKMCQYHRKPMSFSSNYGQLGRFRCRKSNCRTKAESRSTGTWFENVHLPLTFVFQIMYAFSEGLSYHQARKQLCTEESETVLSANTVADWYSYCRETIVVYELEHQEAHNKIGGTNKIVQIDESKFGKRKYNRGRHIESHWVIGMIEDGSDDLRLEVCPDNDRSADVLVPLIKKHVAEGSIIHTDFWRAYMSLPEHGYVHKRVNHSDPTNKFVAPDGTHTQRIASQWRGLKKAFRQEHIKNDFTDWLIEYSWRRKIRINNKDPFDELLKAVKHVYKI